MRQLIEQDDEIGQVLQDHVAQLASDCHETCTPTAYLLHNEQQWVSLHRRLRPLAYSTPAARLPPTPYPFYDMLRLLEEEAPWLVRPEEAASATGAGAAASSDNEGDDPLCCLGPQGGGGERRHGFRLAQANAARQSCQLGVSSLDAACFSGRS